MNNELLNTVSTNFNCEQCGKKFQNIANFVTHKQLYQNVRHFYCDLCDTLFEKLKNFNVHFRQCERRKRFTCEECFETFNHEINLNLHKILHYDKPMKCPECHKIFPRSASFKCHLLMHRVDETVTCDQCQEEFAYYYELQRHIKITHTESFSNTTQLYVCKQCDAAFKRPLELAEHRITHKKIKDTLKIKKKKKIISSKLNVGQTTTKNIKCIVCEKKFAKRSSLERHARTHTGEKPFVCKICNKAFNQKGSLMFHEAKHLPEKPYKCQLCGVGFTQRGNLRTHVMRVHPANAAGRPSYECPLCPCVMRSLQSLNAHLSKRHNDALKFLDVDGSSKFVDSLAVIQLNIQDQIENLPSDDVFYAISAPYDAPETSTNVQEEIAAADSSMVASDQQVIENDHQYEPTVRKTKETKKKSSARLMKGENDGFCGSNIRGVKVRVEDGRNVWLCPYCPRKLARSSDLVRHVRVHTGEKPYKCTICTRAFALRTTRDQHQRTHCGIKPMRCYICFKELATSYTLKAHMRIHKNEAFECERCTKRFRTKAHLNTHWRKWHDGQIGASALTVIAPPTSKTIGRRPDEDSLRTDVVLEEPLMDTDEGLVQLVAKGSYNDPKTMTYSTDETGTITHRPYSCRFCSLKFKIADHLRVHERRHTGEKPFQCYLCERRFITSNSLKDHLKIHSGARNFHCVLCSKTFSTRTTLRRHMFVHTEECPFVCPYCRKRFRRGVLCRRHIKIHRRDVESQLLKQIETTNLSEIHLNSTPMNNYLTETNEIRQSDDIWTSQQTSVEQNFNGNSWNQSTPVVDQSAFIGGHHHLQPTIVDGDVMSGQEIVDSTCLDQFSTAVFSPNGLQNLMNELEAVENNCNLIESSSMHDLQVSQFVTVPSYTIHQPSADVDQSYAFVDEGQNDVLMPPNVIILQCAICCLSFANLHDYQTHLQMHHPQIADDGRRYDNVIKPANHVCTICSVVLTSSQSLNRHMRVVHKEQTVKYACPVCTKQFTRATHVNRHIFHVHRNQKNAPEIGSAVENGVQTEPSTSVDQDIWTTSTSSEIQIESTPNNFADSKVQRRNNSKLNMSGQLPLFDLYRTSDAQTRTTVPSMPSSSLPTNGGDVMMSVSVNNRRQCPNCPKSFKKPSDLARHVRCHTGEKPFPCDECGRTFRVKSTLIAHKKTHVNTTPMHKCQVCNKDFASRGSLKVHFRLHTNERPYSCQMCSETFRSSGKLRHHFAQAHTPISQVQGQPPVATMIVAERNVVDAHPHAFTCAETSAFTPVVRHGTEIRNETTGGIGDELNGAMKIALQIVQEDSNLRLIVKTGILEPVDANTVVVEVTFLRELAANGLTLTIPVSFVEGDLGAGAGDTGMTTVTVNPMEILHHASIAAPSNIVSTYGTSAAWSGVAASSHDRGTGLEQTDSADDGTFVVECQVCDLKFTNSDESRAHFSSNDHETAMLIVWQNDGVKQHLCDRCGKTFPTLLRLRRHVATHTGYRPHVCTICGESFTQKNTLKKHYSARHMRSKPFKCVFCSKIFSHKCNMKKHMDRFHANGDEQNLVSVDSQWPTVDSQREQTFLLSL